MNDYVYAPGCEMTPNNSRGHQENPIALAASVCVMGCAVALFCVLTGIILLEIVRIVFWLIANVVQLLL